MNLKEMMREKVHKVIFENQSSAIRGLEAICQHLISWFVHNTLKQTNKQMNKQKTRKACEQASKQKRKTYLAISV